MSVWIAILLTALIVVVFFYAISVSVCLFEGDDLFEALAFSGRITAFAVAILACGIGISIGLVSLFSWIWGSVQ